MMKTALALTLLVLLSASLAVGQLDDALEDLAKKAKKGCGEPCGNKGNCNDDLTCSGGVCMGNTCPGMKGDPELRGLDGRNFFFDGEVDKCFNFISEQHHQVNAYFVEGPHKIAALGSEGTHNGTYIGALGFKIYDTTLEVAADKEGEMTVNYNGKPLVLDAYNEYKHTNVQGKVNLTVQKYNPEVGQTVSLTSDLYNFFVYVTPRQWDAVEQQVTRGHLNLALAVEPAAYFSTSVHGVLGQITPETAADNSLLPPELGTAFLGEGVDTDYVVSDLFADDFKFNLFNVTSTKMGAGTVAPIPTTVKIAASRRHLSSHIMEQATNSEAAWISIGTGFNTLNY